MKACIERRNFITVLGMTPLLGLIPSAPLQGCIRLFHQGDVVAEQALNFQMDTLMEVPFEHLDTSFDQANIYDNEGKLVSSRVFLPFVLTPAVTLEISWRVSDNNVLLSQTIINLRDTRGITTQLSHTLRVKKKNA